MYIKINRFMVKFAVSKCNRWRRFIYLNNFTRLLVPKKINILG